MTSLPPDSTAPPVPPMNESTVVEIIEPTVLDMTNLEEPRSLQESDSRTVQNEFYNKVEGGEPFQNVVAMAIGLDNGLGGRYGETLNLEDDNRFPSVSSSTDKKKKKRKTNIKWKPTVSGLVDEIKRRKKEYYENKGRSEMSKKSAIEWLLEHPIKKKAHIDIVQEKMAAFFDAIKAVEEEKASSKRDQWGGIIPFLRLIHCLLDSNEIRSALQLSFTVMTREELDGRNNEEIARPCPWAMAADKWNDPISWMS